MEEFLFKTTEKFLVHLLPFIATYPQQKCLKFHFPSFQKENKWMYVILKLWERGLKAGEKVLGLDFFAFLRSFKLLLVVSQLCNFYTLNFS